MNQSELTTRLWLGVVGIGIAILSHKVTWTRATLLFPASSVLQLTASLSVPVVDLPPQRRVGFDWGIQMNYDLPFNLSAFYSAPIWSSRRNPTKRAVASEFKLEHRFDFDLRDFYEYLEQRLEGLGFHKSCLLLCICELAQQTFEWHDLHFITEILNFFARPSLVLNTPANYSQHSNRLAVYFMAEAKGIRNENCANFYGLCEQSPLNLISKIVID